MPPLSAILSGLGRKFSFGTVSAGAQTVFHGQVLPMSFHLLTQNSLHSVPSLAYVKGQIEPRRQAKELGLVRPHDHLLFLNDTIALEEIPSKPCTK